MSQGVKRSSLLFLMAALVSLVLLSGSLSNLQLHAGTAFPGSDNSTSISRPVPHLAPVEIYFSPFLKGILAIVCLALMLQVSVRLIALISFKQTLRLLLGIIVLAAIAGLISYLVGSRSVYHPNEFLVVTPPPSSEYPVSPLGRPPQGFIQVVFVCFLLGVSFLAISILKRRQSRNSTEYRLSLEAESALNSIRAGENLRHVILRCYLQMTHVLQEELDIERNEDMTVRDFEDWLVSKGFPANPLNRLGRLYETVRYGQQEMSEQDEAVALQCLEDIIQFCRGRRKPG